MVGERLQAKRLFTSPILKLIIREGPVSTDAPVPSNYTQVYPIEYVVEHKGDVNITSASELMEVITDDITQAFADVENVDVNRDINVTDDISMLRGLGEFREATILVNVKGAIPKEVNEAVERLIDDGYLFSIIKFV